MKTKLWKTILLFAGLILAGAFLYVWYRISINPADLMEGTFV
jgi:hypothetical protein